MAAAEVARLRRSTGDCRALTDLTPVAFDQPLAPVEPRHAAAMGVPHEKPEGRELPPRKTAGNRRPSRRRVAAEHGIGKMRVWRIASDRYRGPRRRHTLVFEHAAGPHNVTFA